MRLRTNYVLYATAQHCVVLFRVNGGVQETKLRTLCRTYKYISEVTKWPERGKNVRKSKVRDNTFLRKKQQKADLFIEHYKTHKNEFWIIWDKFSTRIISKTEQYNQKLTEHRQTKNLCKHIFFSLAYFTISFASGTVNKYFLKR